MALSYAWRLISRNLRRTLTYLFGLALAVGLFSGVLFFVDASASQMTTIALAPVKLDIVAHATTPSVDVAKAAQSIVAQRGIKAAEPVFTADFASAGKPGGSQMSHAGRMFAMNPSYFQTFDIVQLSAGRFGPGGAVVSEGIATALNLKLGDTIQITFNSISRTVQLPITGITNVASADALFSSTSGAENTLITDVVLVDAGWFSASLGPQLAAVPPSTTSAGSGMITYDPAVHIKIDRSLLPADPTLAALHSESLRRQVERVSTGQLKATDNLLRAFNTVKSDVLSAKILFIFLGLPGVALAAYLSKFAAELFAEAQRRELSLLRTRGATPRQITAIVAISSLMLAILGSAFGLLIGVLSLFVAASAQGVATLNPLSAQFDWQLLGSSALISFVAGLVLTFLAAFLPTFAALRREITQERRTVQRIPAQPFWKRAYLDVICLVAAVIILFVTQQNGGFKPSANESAAIALSFYIFLAPFFAWVGLTLLVLRLMEWGLTRSGGPVAAIFRRLFGDIGEVAGKSIARRARQVGAATTVIALTLSFGMSLTLFQQTYSHEKQLDSQYVVGSDIRFTPALNSAQTPDFASKLQLPGVQGVTAIARDPQALVGSEKNTVYGIDVLSFRQVAYLPDSFFIDGAAQRTVDAMTNRTTDYAPGSASQVLNALHNTPNGVIISVEQAEKYNIRVGDPVLMQLYNPTTRKYVNVQAQAVGMFIYFPTSSQDSDFILNRSFMLGQSETTAVDYFLLKTDGQAKTTTALADQLTAQYKNVMPVRIQTTATVIKGDQNSLTAMNLVGLSAMEQLYTVLVASIGLTVFLMAMINERQREFGAMRALGATLGHLRRFLFAEAVTIGGISLLLGGLIGILLAQMLVMLLGVIFTIPANGLSWPGLELLLLAGVVVLGMLGSAILSARRLAGLRVVEALREM